MTNREELRRKLNDYSKEEIIDAILLSTAATGFVLNKCKTKKALKPNKSDASKKEAK